MKSLISAGFIIFIILKIVLFKNFENLNPWVVAFLEGLLAFIVIFSLKQKHSNSKPTRKHWYIVAILTTLGLILGFSIPIATTLPWDLKNTQNLLWLLLIAPVLEELVFRWALIDCLKIFRLKKLVMIICSAILFSLAHWIVGWYYPDFEFFTNIQALYTFVLGLGCAWIFLQYGFIYSVILHFLFNLFFCIGAFFHMPIKSANTQNSVTIVIVDMPLVGTQEIPKNVKIIRNAKISSTFREFSEDQCIKDQEFTNAVLNEHSETTNDLSERERVLKFIARSHGWHSLSQVAYVADNIIYIEASWPLVHFENIDDYLQALNETYNNLYLSLTNFPNTQHVLVAASDTYEENYVDLINKKIEDTLAHSSAQSIINLQKEWWLKLLNEFEEKRFWISAGNGDIEGNPINIEHHEVIPGSLNFNNLIRVGSLDVNNCPSLFSNFGLNNLWASGELIDGGSHCIGLNKEFQLSGTSQALYQAFINGPMNIGNNCLR